jgi:5-methylcytosine-specific restriction endonuclease McrA
MIGVAMNYADYIKSPDWHARRIAAIRRAGGRCQLCGSTGPLQVHHNTYERLGKELSEDLCVLCVRHHKMFHETEQVLRPFQRLAS